MDKSRWELSQVMRGTVRGGGGVALHDVLIRVTSLVLSSLHFFFSFFFFGRMEWTWGLMAISNSWSRISHPRLLSGGYRLVSDHLVPSLWSVVVRPLLPSVRRRLQPPVFFVVLPTQHPVSSFPGPFSDG